MYLDQLSKFTILHTALWMAPDERVRLAEWRLSENQEDNGISDKELVNTCGTTGCAIGWGTSLPIFRALGLKMKIGHPQYDSVEGWEAVCRFFEITESQAYALFYDIPEHSGKVDADDLLEITGAKPGLDTESHLTDREKVLRRIRRFLDAQAGELDSFEKKQLKKGERIRKTKEQ